MALIRQFVFSKNMIDSTQRLITHTRHTYNPLILISTHMRLLLALLAYMRVNAHTCSHCYLWWLRILRHFGHFIYQKNYFHGL